VSARPSIQGLLSLATACEVCGLDYSFADPADGPAFFAMSIVAVPALAFVLWLQFNFDTPLWIHVVLILPLTFAARIVLLRLLEG